MELTYEQLGYVKRLISAGVVIDEALKEFPEAEIAIIRGYDEFPNQPYVKGAYFSRSKAADAAKKIPRNGDGDLSDTYLIIASTVSNLRGGVIMDSRTEKLLDDIDIALVHCYLSAQLDAT
ncbi:MAG: hypothetical protein HYW23_00440 [Candidatus Aenigmarchaeota archaeon]|nr:hypothetical protein [Candidatus Aenigmarchaeota archaeon]